MSYFVIHTSADGVFVEKHSKESLKEVIDFYGEQIRNEIPSSDPNEWGDSLLIIKGEIVVPKPKDVVKTWEID